MTTEKDSVSFHGAPEAGRPASCPSFQPKIKGQEDEGARRGAQHDRCSVSAEGLVSPSTTPPQ